ncbi:MAG TPA: DUF6127 family protein [Candidatus Sulfotelmatobacter sp.]|nr:DUF6127 family protein [Candidatus Sulfotelmatobacter sp.]
MTDEQIEALLERAASRGANEALRRIGLGDEGAGDDVRQVRNLLDAWRTAKHITVHAVIDVLKKLVAWLFFAFIILALGKHIPAHLNPFDGN